MAASSLPVLPDTFANHPVPQNLAVQEPQILHFFSEYLVGLTPAELIDFSPGYLQALEAELLLMVVIALEVDYYCTGRSIFVEDSVVSLLGQSVTSDSKFLPVPYTAENRRGTIVLRDVLSRCTTVRDADPRAFCVRIEQSSNEPSFFAYEAPQAGFFGAEAGEGGLGGRSTYNLHGMRSFGPKMYGNPLSERTHPYHCLSPAGVVRLHAEDPPVDPPVPSPFTYPEPRLASPTPIARSSPSHPSAGQLVRLRATPVGTTPAIPASVGDFSTKLPVALLTDPCPWLAAMIASYPHSGAQTLPVSRLRGMVLPQTEQSCTILSYHDRPLAQVVELRAESVR